MLDEPKVRITAAVVIVTKDIVQRDWQDVEYRQDVCRATDSARCEVFLILCVKIVYQLKNKILETTPSYLISFLRHNYLELYVAYSV
jgi:hypothetical protein